MPPDDATPAGGGNALTQSPEPGKGAKGAEGAKRVPKKKPTPSTASGRDGQLVALGPLGTPYLLCTDDARAMVVAEHIWAEAGKVELRWPRVGEAEIFLNGIRGFAEKSRCLHEEGTGLALGFPGGRSKAHAYQVKSYCRGMAAVVEATMPGVIEEMAVAQVLQFTPDERKHAEPITSMSGPEVIRKFGMSALWVSCWACIAGYMVKPDKDNHIGFCFVVWSFCCGFRR